MNTPKDYITIYLQLIQIGVLEVVIFLMTSLIKYVPNKTDDLNLGMLNMIIRINESKQLAKHIS